jgi:hypothetical protein
MSTKELIQAELDTLSDEDLDALYALIKRDVVINHAALNRDLMPVPRGNFCSCW